MSMSLEVSLEWLHRELSRLSEALSALHLTVSEDKPPSGTVPQLVDQLDNLITDLSGTIEEAGAHVDQVLSSTQPNGSLDATRVGLHRAQELFNRFTSSYASELATYDYIARLLQMGREREHGWWQWSQVVKTAIDRCATPASATAAAMLECWSELADRFARGSVSVQATNIGQQITVRDDQLELTEKAT
jgi:hypothetical protein